eukprot:IDg1597t1
MCISATTSGAHQLCEPTLGYSVAEMRIASVSSITIARCALHARYYAYLHFLFIALELAACVAQRFAQNE